jgi:hypothetical protein
MLPRLFALLLFLAAIVPAHAALHELSIESRKPWPADPSRFELLEGHFRGDLDPAAKQNGIINDLTLAPRNAQGRVEYRATFAILRPLGPASGLLVYDVANRGRITVTAFPQGHISVISGWQGACKKRRRRHFPCRDPLNLPHKPDIERVRLFHVLRAAERPQIQAKKYFTRIHRLSAYCGKRGGSRCKSNCNPALERVHQRQLV